MLKTHTKGHTSEVPKPKSNRPHTHTHTLSNTSETHTVTWRGPQEPRTFNAIHLGNTVTPTNSPAP